MKNFKVIAFFMTFCALMTACSSESTTEKTVSNDSPLYDVISGTEEEVKEDIVELFEIYSDTADDYIDFLERYYALSESDQTRYIAKWSEVVSNYNAFVAKVNDTYKECQEKDYLTDADEAYWRNKTTEINIRILEALNGITENDSES